MLDLKYNEGEKKNKGKSENYRQKFSLFVYLETQ